MAKFIHNLKYILLQKV